MNTLTPDQMVESYVKIREAKDKAKKSFTEATERMNAALEKLEGMMQEVLENTGAESIKTNFGTVYQKKRSNCSVKDREEFYRWAVSTDNLSAIDMKANAKIVRELLEEGIQVPGVKYSEAKLIGVRRA